MSNIIQNLKEYLSMNNYNKNSKSIQVSERYFLWFWFKNYKNSFKYSKQYDILIVKKFK